MAMASAAALDSLNIIGMVGTIAEMIRSCVLWKIRILKNCTEIDHDQKLKRINIQREIYASEFTCKNLALINELIPFDEHLNILTENRCRKICLDRFCRKCTWKNIKRYDPTGSKRSSHWTAFWIEDQKLIKEIEALDLEVEDGQIIKRDQRREVLIRLTIRWHSTRC